MHQNASPEAPLDRQVFSSRECWGHVHNTLVIEPLTKFVTEQDM